MSDQPLMPSEVRRKVLGQHREIEQLLSELETGVARLCAGTVEAGQVKRAAYALRGILELHMNFEDAYLAPAIEEARLPTGLAWIIKRPFEARTHASGKGETTRGLLPPVELRRKRSKQNRRNRLKR